ncbi:MAG: ribbon-helix-helix protein, CopG family [Proteobacteria bacterium]|nr:ribbon-helix-helix protein, CopG family [Pseudomonadota bacterium]
MTIRLDEDVRDRLDRLAEATHCSRSFLVTEAVRAYIEMNDWRVSEIHAALKEADAGDFAGDKDVAVLSRRWKGNAR